MEKIDELSPSPSLPSFPHTLSRYSSLKDLEFGSHPSHHVVNKEEDKSRSTNKFANLGH